MASVTDIPELVKTMYSLFGEKWGKRIGRTIVILILGGVLGGAIVAITAGINAITSWATNLSPTASNILLAFLSAIIVLIGILGISAGLGLLLGLLLRIGLAIPIRRNIDLMLERTEAVLLRAKQSETPSADVDKLLSELNLLKNQWEASRTTRLVNWITRKKKSEL